MLCEGALTGFPDPHPPDQFNQWNPCFRLLQYRDDLFDVESLLFHGNSPFLGYSILPETNPCSGSKIPGQLTTNELDDGNDRIGVYTRPAEHALVLVLVRVEPQLENKYFLN